MSIASRIRDLQKVIGGDNPDTTDSTPVYSEVVKPKLKSGEITNNHQTSQPKPPAAKWQPVKPNIQDNQTNINNRVKKGCVTDLVNSNGKKIGKSPPSLPSKINRPKVGNGDNSEAQDNGTDEKVAAKFEKGCVRPSQLKQIQKGPFKVSDKDDITKEEKTSFDDKCVPLIPSQLKQSPGGAGKSPVLKPTIPPSTPPKVNRPKLHAVGIGTSDMTVDSGSQNSDSDNSPSPITQRTPPPNLPNKLLRSKLSHSESSSSETSQDGRPNVKLRRSDTSEKIGVKHFVAKMNTPPPMVPNTITPFRIPGNDDTNLTGRPLPPTPPAKQNRPCLRQQNSGNQEDLRSSVDRLGLENSSPILSPLTRAKWKFRSADNLDHDESADENGVKQEVDEIDNESCASSKGDKLSRKKRISRSLQGVKSLAVLKKFLTSGSTDDKKDDDKNGGETRTAIKRKSVGDSFRANLANISNIFRKKQDETDGSMTTRSDNDSSTDGTTPEMHGSVSGSNGTEHRSSDNLTSKKTTLRTTESAPLLATATSQQIARSKSLKVGEGAGEGGSTYENISILNDHHNSSGDALDEDSYDDDEWDDDFSDPEDTEVQNLKSKALSYESYDSEHFTLLNEKKRQIVEEMVSTETSYVNRLYMLNKTAWEIGGANIVLEMFQTNKVHHMFPSIEALYRLHGENILPALKTTLEDWPAKPEIYPMWRKYLPFLTMYKSYTSHYDGALDIINQYKKSCPEFLNLINKLEERAEFGKLTLEHHLIEPIQRLGRYKLLLQNYCKLLLEDEDEFAKITGVVQSFDQLLNDCQNQLQRRDTFGDLYKLQERFEDTLSMLSPTAHLLREGAMVQISGNAYKKKIQRHLFLFSDCVLICTKRSSGKMRIVHQIELTELKIRPVDVACAALHGGDRTMILKDGDLNVIILFRTDESKAEWEEAILDAITVKLMEGELRRSGSMDLCQDGVPDSPALPKRT